MKMSRKHPITSCRPHSLFGAWAIEPIRFLRMKDAALAADLTRLAAARIEAERITGTQPEEDPYEMLPGGIARLCLSGPMVKYETSFDCMFGCCCTTWAKRAIRQAAQDGNVRAMVLDVDSPGGTVAGTPDLADAVWEFRQEKPIVAYASDLCCSGMYWVVSQCDSIFANQNAAIGNIGCYSLLEDTTGLQEKIGVKQVVVSTGAYKGLGADGKVTDTLVADVQREVDSIHNLFVAAIARGRSLPLESVAALADGRAYIGQQAVNLGLADGIMSVEQAIETLETYMNVTEPSVALPYPQP